MDDKDKVKYKVGDKVYVLIRDLHKDRKYNLHDVVITKVGRKYVYFKSVLSGWLEDKISLDKNIVTHDNGDVIGRVLESEKDYSSTQEMLGKATILYRALMGSVWTGNFDKMNIEEKTALIKEMDHIINVFTKEKRNNV